MNRTTIDAVALALQAQQPVLLVGDPGIGKTSVMYAIGRSLERQVRVIPAHVYSQEDIGGFPAPDFDRGFVRMLPNEALFSGLTEDEILFWDEINQADDHKQGALMRVILENRAGVHAFPDRVSHAAAMNPTDRSAGGTDIQPPLANRFMWLPCTVDTKAWCEAAIKGFPNPVVPRTASNWRLLIAPKLTLVVAYVRARSDVLLRYPKTHAEACGPWASPRTMTALATMDAACESAGCDDDVRMVCFSGLIGNAGGTEYLTYIRELDLPDTEELLQHPLKFKLPVRGDQRYAVLASVVGAVVRHFTDDRYYAAWQIFDIAREGGAADIVVASAKSLAQMHTKLKAGRMKPLKEMEKFMPLLKAAGYIGSAA